MEDGGRVEGGEREKADGSELRIRVSHVTLCLGIACDSDDT